MPEYRLYTINDDDRIAGASVVRECANDDEAAAHAQQALNGCAAVEIWCGSRLVRRVTASGTELRWDRRDGEPAD